MKNIPIQAQIFIALLAAFIVYNTVVLIIGPGVDLYNNTKKLELSLNKMSQKQVSNYDGYYLAFIAKTNNASINQETFLQVTSIIMENRRDGENVAWSWSQENQQIPYEEFSVFYKELSSFITERYKDNMLLEEAKQSIVEQHNTLLLTFPNTFYNSFLSIKPLVYEVGYISAETKLMFNK